MDKFDRVRKLLRVLVEVLGFTLFAAMSIFGLFAIYVFLLEPALKHLPIDPVDVVFAFGMFAIGMSTLVAARRKTNTAAWLNGAHIFAWFLLYSVTFDVSREVSPNFRSAVSIAVNFISLVGFIIVARRSYLKERNKKRDAPNVPPS